MDNTDSKPIIGVIIATIIIFIGGIFLFTKNPPGNNTANYLLNSNSHILGKKDAKVKIVEFSDFECPACAAAEETVQKVLDKYKDKVLFSYRHYPLPMHNYSRKAAEAAEAAGAQGKFWEMKSIMFKNQKNLKPEDLLKYAKEIGLNIDQFKKDLENKKYKEIVEKDKTDGDNLNLEGTPTFFINGKKIFGIPPLGEFQSLIEKS